MYTLTFRVNGRFRFSWALDTKDEAILQAVKVLRRYDGGAAVITHGVDIVWCR